MIFKPINLARQSLIKTFTHSYAQSLVAATHPTSAPQNHTFHSLSNNVATFFGKPPTSNSNANGGQHVQPSFPTPSAGGAGAGRPRQLDASNNDGGLAAYYAAWQNHHKPEDKEWHQFQFAKRIGWKAPTTIPEAPAKPTGSATPKEHVRTRSGGVLERANSTSALDDLRKSAETEEAEIVAAQQAEAAVAEQNAYEEHTLAVAEYDSYAAASQAADGQSELVRIDSPATTFSPSVETASQAVSTVATSFSEGDAHTEQLVQLAELQRYAEIPAIFEALLVAGIKPSSSAYNALLLSAIHLTNGKHHVVPKALDVYSDMLRRRVTPDTATYAILIEMLAARSIDVNEMKNELDGKRTRYGSLDNSGAFMFRSDEAEFNIVAEDDSLSLAIKLFDTCAAVSTMHMFPAETYRMLIVACAERGLIGDMVRIYANMEGQSMEPPSEIFGPMIRAFASVGDLRSSVECYDEYKALAIAHNRGTKTIARKDDEVYAAVVKAYAMCDRTTDGLKFLAKIEDELANSHQLPAVRDAVALQALHPEWMKAGRHNEALAHALEKLSSSARQQALLALCIDAADKNLVHEATAAYQRLVGSGLPEASAALLAMHLRTGDMHSAQALWTRFKAMPATATFVEPTTMYALSLLGCGEAREGLQASRAMFSRMRSEATDQQARTEIVDRIDEAVEVLGKHLLMLSPVAAPAAAIGLIWTMVENGTLVTPLAERLLAGLGPETISQLSMADVNMLMQTQASILSGTGQLDVAHLARFTHLMDILGSNMAETDQPTVKLVNQALEKLNRPDLTFRWQSLQHQASTPMLSPVQYRPRHASTAPLTPMAFEDAYDPYGSSTDFKGSNAIAEELDKSYGRYASHLNEALARFKNMRRVGRHPRYVTYAKLITAAAKENRLNLAQDILAMAQQDVPLVQNNRVVRQGWTSILDSMVGACLSLGHRDLAEQHHRELLQMGAAPSANTFGLYITTLKESTRTFDEATEAVKIFQRAKREGVEPSSFLYNALIGKLGKARRIDDCLFYFAEMRNLGIRPTSVTYGTVVNALCRVSDDKFAEELFEEMESMPNYKPRPAPYNSLMQYFLTTKRDRSKVLAYYERMKANHIPPTMHTYKLLIDTYATLEPIDMGAAEALLAEIPTTTGAQPEAVHYASLIHAKGCVQHDLAGARALFDSVLAERRVPPQASLYQALFEAMVANHDVAATEHVLSSMTRDHGVALTPYIANTLIHGWAMAGDIAKAKQVFERVGRERREPSTYEAMTRAYLAVEDHANAMCVVGEALRRGYPAAVANKICELVGGGSGAASAGASGNGSGNGNGSEVAGAGAGDHGTAPAAQDTTQDTIAAPAIAATG